MGPVIPHPTSRSPGVRRALRLCAALMLLASVVPVRATVAIGGLRDADFGVWSPSGGASVVRQDFCVTSFAGGPRDWAATLEDRSGASTGTGFGIASVSGGDALPLTVRLLDLRSGASEPLEPGLSTPETLTGARRNCPDGLNARLELRIEAGAFAAATAGTFEGRFELLAKGRGRDSASFTIRARVPDLVRISGLDEIDLGRFPGSGDLVGEDQLCVYRNDPSARYDLSARGAGSSRGFILGTAPGGLPFELEFDDGDGFAPLEPGVQIRARGADTEAIGCRGGGNARLRVRVREVDLRTAEVGSYAGTVTLTVAPI